MYSLQDAFMFEISHGFDILNIFYEEVILFVKNISIQFQHKYFVLPFVRQMHKKIEANKINLLAISNIISWKSK